MSATSSRAATTVSSFAVCANAAAVRVSLRSVEPSHSTTCLVQVALWDGSTDLKVTRTAEALAQTAKNETVIAQRDDAALMAK